MYKVRYKTFGIMPDGTSGNVVQSVGTLYTDHSMSNIQRALNDMLEPKKRVAQIVKIEMLDDGIVLAKEASHD